MGCAAVSFSSAHTAFANASADAVAQAEHLFQTRSFDSAFEKFKSIQADAYASPADLALSRCRLGIIYSIRDEQKQARNHLELSLSSNALQAPFVPLCYYALVQIYVMDKSFSEARSLMQRYPDPVFPAQYKARVFAIGVEVARQLKDLESEVAYLERLARVMERAGLDKVDLKILGDWSISLADIKKRLGEAQKPASEPTPVAQQSAPAEKLEDKSAVPVNTAKAPEITEAAPSSTLSIKASTPAASSQVQSEVQNGPLSRDILSALRAMRDGQLDVAASEAREPKPTLTSEKLLAGHLQLEQVRERAENLLKDDPRHMRIGLILPRGTGTIARLQLRALKGVSAFLNSRAVKDVDYQVFVRTVANDSGASEQAAVELILKDKVHAIVGPFHGAQTAGALTTAAFLGVPLYALGPATAAREFDSNFNIRMGTLANSQARAQVEFLKQQNRKSVAILSPTDGYGVEMSKAFEAVCKAEGLQIQRIEFVDEYADVFQEPVKALLGPQDGKNRGPEYAKLVAEARKKAAQEKRKFDPSAIKAPANVPFSALFVPDSLDRARLVANTFAFFDARNVRYLGDRTWQEAGGRQSIADQFLNGARVPVAKAGAFLPFLRRELAAGESVLDIERQAFDSLLLTRTAHYKAGGNNPAKLARALQAADFLADGAGKYGPVDASGEPSLQFDISQYHNGSVLSPNTNPESFSSVEDHAQ